MLLNDRPKVNPPRQWRRVKGFTENAMKTTLKNHIHDLTCTNGASSYQKQKPSSGAASRIFEDGPAQKQSQIFPPSFQYDTTPLIIFHVDRADGRPAISRAVRAARPSRFDKFPYMRMYTQRFPPLKTVYSARGHLQKVVWGTKDTGSEIRLLPVCPTTGNTRTAWALWHVTLHRVVMSLTFSLRHLASTSCKTKTRKPQQCGEGKKKRL